MSGIKVYVASNLSKQMSRGTKLEMAWLDEYNKLGAAKMNEMYKSLRDFHEERCCKCGVNRFEHETTKHPFFQNNLEMLEYYSEQRTT